MLFYFHFLTSYPAGINPPAFTVYLYGLICPDSYIVILPTGQLFDSLSCLTGLYFYCHSFPEIFVRCILYFIPGSIPALFPAYCQNILFIAIYSNPGRFGKFLFAYCLSVFTVFPQIAHTVSVFPPVSPFLSSVLPVPFSSFSNPPFLLSVPLQ